MLFIAYAGQNWFTGLVAVVAGLALQNSYAMGLPEGRRPERLLATACGVLLIPLFGLAPFPWGVGALALTFWCSRWSSCSASAS